MTDRIPASKQVSLRRVSGKTICCSGMLTVISQRPVLRHSGIHSRARLGASGLLLFGSKLISSTAASRPGCPQRSVEKEKARKRKRHRTKRRPNSNRTSRTIQKYSGTSSVSSTRSQVFISLTGMASIRLPENRGRLHGSPKPIAQMISFKSGKPRRGRRKKRPKPLNLQKAVRTLFICLRTLSMLLFTRSLKCEYAYCCSRQPLCDTMPGRPEIDNSLLR